MTGQGTEIILGGLADATRYRDPARMAGFGVPDRPWLSALRPGDQIIPGQTRIACTFARERWLAGVPTAPGVRR
jgi:hypothetical protein